MIPDTLSEARRCLLCKKPKCSLQGCPVHTPVPECMALFREGDPDAAARLLFANNPLSAVTSVVCDWKQFCFGNCVLNVKGVPIHWYQVEQEISGNYLKKVTLERSSSRLEGKRIAIVGAGPAGIAAAVWLYQAGAGITLFDANPRIGGVLRYGIPSFRLDRALVDEYERILDVPGIEFIPGRKIESAKELADEYDSVILCSGAEIPAKLGIPGEEKAVQALHYLREPFDLGGKMVIVIGGGNVAMDACRTAARSGAETWVYYRKTFENMPANPLEVEQAKTEGVLFRVFQAPVEIKDNGVVFCDCENVVPEGGGRVVTRIIEGTEHFVQCDSLVTAISEKPDFSILEGTGAILNKWGWPEAGEDMVIAGTSNIYACGDFLLGPRTVVEAVASARKVVDAL